MRQKGVGGLGILFGNRTELHSVEPYLPLAARKSHFIWFDVATGDKSSLLGLWPSLAMFYIF